MIEIDGSYGEGGGQTIRTAVALSAVSGKPVHITNIRANRPEGGLKPQHFAGVEALAKICSADAQGLSVGSKELVFTPKKIRGGSYKINTGTAGSVFLVLQTLIPACLHADKTVTLEITGGTDVSWAPPSAYMTQVFAPMLERLGVTVSIKIQKYGFYPKGGGKILAVIEPSSPRPLELVKRGKLLRYDAWSVTSEDLKGVAEREMKGAEEVLGPIAYKKLVYTKTTSPGTSFHVNAHYENTIMGEDSLGAKGVPAEEVGRRAASSLEKQMDTKACMDRHMADQLLVYMALAGRSKVSVTEVTSHTKTNIWTIEKFLPVVFDVDENLITVKGK